MSARRILYTAVWLALLVTILPAQQAAKSGDARRIWQVWQIDAQNLPADIVPEDRKPAPHGLPDGLVATHDGTGDIASAWYAMPTKRYGHGILGDAIEAGELVVHTPGGSTLSLRLPETEVFEDRYPRLADLDGDGRTEIVTIRTSLTKGASVTIYGIRNDTLIERASTPFIGRANRWLNIAGIGRFFGGNGKQIAFVQTPHIGGTLYIYEFDGAELVKAASMHGFSNHVIGSPELRLSALADINDDGAIDLALPSDDRNVLRIMGFVNGTLAELASARLPSRIDKAIAVERAPSGPAFIVGLGNGKVYRVNQLR